MESIIVTETNTGDIANLFNEVNTGDGNKTYTDSELHELLDFVEGMDNATTADDCESCSPIQTPFRHANSHVPVAFCSPLAPSRVTRLVRVRRRVILGSDAPSRRLMRDRETPLEGDGASERD